MKASRRVMLKKAALAAGLAVAPWAGSALAQSGKAAKKDMHYQDKPKDGQQCATCIQFIPGAKPGASGECQIVEGPISPNGWGIEYIKENRIKNKHPARSPGARKKSLQHPWFGRIPYTGQIMTRELAGPLVMSARGGKPAWGPW